ncbi:aldo/keto reductase [Rhodococcus sp. (in: high G+C Gram-positive bacteria)]|uniref:aldo/keto reductase n=1 Tax=unclassified Rhodococcus (in: high G+C Gram-positive bacteria) TaxID=192944 RepID=UPI002ADAFAF7|nr:aldo/keto reductase [Rhodococcus sp. (in: high G+C Gram-positive bacteria)]MDZ7930149.1 aldo/keto reductase [Rhodococcus sp. (in: high G+C Gram-positive bacteria)]
MKYVQLGSSALRVSRIALGGMSFGHRSSRNPWTLDKENAEPIFRRAVDLGITLWDTANVYGNGTSEEILGDAMRRFTRREDVALATKVGLPMHDGPTGTGLSRAAIRAQLDASLRRLKTDYVDLYQIHRFDPHTPTEETMATLHEVVTAGKARFIGASSMAAWQFASMQHTAELGGWTRFVSMQDQYSLVQREEEREMFGLLADQGVASLPWCPLTKGRLARPYGMATHRSRTDPTGQRFFDNRDQPIIDTVERLSLARRVPMAQVALAWVLAQPVVAAPVVGASRAGHLDDAAAAVDLTLSSEDLHALAAPYTSREPSGY